MEVLGILLGNMCFSQKDPGSGESGRAGSGGKAVTFALDSHCWPDPSGSWRASGTWCWKAGCSWWLSPFPRPPCTGSVEGEKPSCFYMEKYILVSF